MRIGIDFDNTIANYHGVFHAVATKISLIDSSTSLNKKSVKEAVIQKYGEDKWTELQGFVYGSDIEMADLFEGFKESVLQFKAKGFDVFVVSHKTQYPVIGAKVNLHDAAKAWLNNRNIIGEGDNQVPATQAFFELTQTDKVKRIEQLHLDYFIDDLPEFLSRTDFPKSVQRILFDPDHHYQSEDFPSFKLIHSWCGIGAYFDGIK